MKTIKILTFILLSAIAIPLHAQDSAPSLTGRAGGESAGAVEATLSVDLVNQYIWRGMDLGDVSMQPTLGIEWRGLTQCQSP